MSRQVVNAITQSRGPDQYLRMLTSYIGFKKQALPYAPINRTGTPTVRPKGEALNLARALVMDHSTHPLRWGIWIGVLLVTLNLVFMTLHTIGTPEHPMAFHTSLMFWVIALMIAVVGEYVGGLSSRTRDRPAYYVREEHTSSVLLREDRKNVVQQS
jgi:dolichol-phosphate mannosyltransferase